MHPRSCGARPGREDLMVQVTNNGLYCAQYSGYPTTRRRNILLVVGERRGDGSRRGQGTVERIEGVEAVL